MVSGDSDFGGPDRVDRRQVNLSEKYEPSNSVFQILSEDIKFKISDSKD